jgi:hypothetical protein
MSQKSPAKSKGLAKAELNFVSQQSFEQVIEQLHNLSSRHIKPYIAQIDEDTALFQLRYVHDDNTTAEVSGRMKRWAGNMTHIYCGGRVFRKHNLGIRLRRRRTDILVFIALWVYILTSFLSGGSSSPTVSTFFFGGLIAFIIALICYGVFNFMRMLAKIVAEAITAQTIQFRNYFKSKPEAKDRERLFHAITTIIRDNELAENAMSLEAAIETKPLTEAEEAHLVAQITLEASKQNL